jgi:hypothetical protein
MLKLLCRSSEDRQGKPLTSGIGGHVVEAFAHRFELRRSKNRSKRSSSVRCAPQPALGLDLRKLDRRGRAAAEFEEEKEIAKNQIFKIEHMAGVIGDRAALQI